MKPSLAKIILLSVTLCICIQCSPPKDSSFTSSPVATPSAPARLFEKSEKGIDFIAYGTNWSLDIDLEKGITLTTKITEKNLSTASLIEIPAPNNGASTFSAQTEKGQVTVTLIKSDCSVRNGEKFDHQVKVDVKYASDQSNTISYKGCGRYLPDYRLHNLWVVTALNGKEISKDGSPKGAPEMEINTIENRVMGHGGCNSFTGEIKMQGDQISFGQMAATKMACPGMQIENDFFSILALHPLHFKFETNLLKIYEKEREVLALKNID